MRFKKSGKSKPQLMDDEPTPVPGAETEWSSDATRLSGDSICAPTPLAGPPLDEPNQIDAAQRIAAKVAKLLAKPRAPVADQLRIAHLALLAIAAGPKSVSRDIAVTALKVVTS